MPLSLAVQASSPACFKQLLDFGADPTVSDGSNNCLQVILKNILNLIFKENFLPFLLLFQVALTSSQYGLARWILSTLPPAQGATLLLQKNREGLSALMMLVGGGGNGVNLTFMEELLCTLRGWEGGKKGKGDVEKVKGALEFKGKDGRTVFHRTYHERFLLFYFILFYFILFYYFFYLILFDFLKFDLI